MARLIWQNPMTAKWIKNILVAIVLVASIITIYDSITNITGGKEEKSANQKN